MSVFAIEQNEDYSRLVDQLKKHVSVNNKAVKGKEKEIERMIDEVDYALHELIGNKQFDKSTYLKLKLQK